MSNMKKRDFYDVITGDNADIDNYGSDASIFKRVDNIDMLFDSRGQYLGLRISRGKIVNGKFTTRKGPYDFRSADDLKIWEGIHCSKVNFIESKDGNFIQIGK